MHRAALPARASLHTGHGSARRLGRTAVRALPLAALVATIPAFYLELLTAEPTPLAEASYGLAALVVGASAWLRARRQATAATSAWRQPPGRWLSIALVIGLVLAALLPASAASPLALGVRSVTAVMTLAHLVWSLQHVLARGSLPVLLTLALAVLALCGIGFWWLEPRALTLADGLWLAFTTAATVGYGDIVPTTPASKIFAVFVVLLGYGVLSMVTAAIATMWVESRERQIEREILHDLHRQLMLVRDELRTLRAQRGPSDSAAD